MVAKRRGVFVTVGTTKFEALIRAVDSPELASVLRSKGYTHLTIQKGAGDYVPCQLVPPGITTGKHTESGLHVEYFDFAPSLAEHIAGADLIISHAGSGSIFETLTAGKPLLVVPNPLLMDNHQAELGDHLAAMGAVVCAEPDGLLDAVRVLDVASLRPLPPRGRCSITDSIDEFMGRPRLAD